MREKILTFIEKNSRIDLKELAIILGVEEVDIVNEMEQMEKEGVKFMNVNKTDVHKKKRTGAIIGAAVMTVLMLITIIIVLWANTLDPIPLGMLLFITGIPIVVIVGTLIALAGRMKEIEGGEEDEASKY